MNYKVKIMHLFSEVFNIEASDIEEAKEKAATELQKEDREIKASYDLTLPSEHWPVITEEKYNEMVSQFEAELTKQKEENKE